MSEKTAIAWTDHTFNPWMGCVKVSDGCKNCYAETLTKNRMGLDVWGLTKKRQRTSQDNWKNPHAWNAQAIKDQRQHRVFSGSLCDIFEDHKDLKAIRTDLWATIRATPYLDWQLLTKRPENIPLFLPLDWEDGFANVWLGTSIEDMRVAWRADALRKIPARIRFISYEPALGPLDKLNLTGIQWIIYGGESGPGYRGHDLAWPRAMRDRCKKEGIAFFYKQSPAWRTEMGITLDGETVRQYPKSDAIQSELQFV
jgi:protein gp37